MDPRPERASGDFKETACATDTASVSEIQAPRRQVTIEREGLLSRLASAFQRRDLEAFEPVMRPDMELTLPGTSRLAGTYHGYRSFARYLEALRYVLRSAELPITFVHEGNTMVFRQVMVVSGPKHQVEMALRVTVRFHRDERVESFFVQPEDQGLFDYVIDSSFDDRAL
jgi:ketosteroid isomerase-like protein